MKMCKLIKIYSENFMIKLNLLLPIMCVSFALGEYDYSLQDINPSSEYYEQNVGTSLFPGEITLHYFGHYN